MKLLLILLLTAFIAKSQQGFTLLTPNGNSIKTSSFQIGNGNFTNKYRFSSNGIGTDQSSEQIYLPFLTNPLTSNFGVNSMFEAQSNNSGNITIKSSAIGGYNYNIGVFSKSGDENSTGFMSVGLLGDAFQKSTMGLGIGVYGVSYDSETSLNTTNYNAGVQGYSLTYARSAVGGYFYSYTKGSNSNTSIGVRALASGDVNSNGIKYGIYAQSTGSGTLYAGYFSGNVHVNGNLSKSGGTFKIDHPLDPENKYLQHSFVESPEMMNIYNGIVTTNNKGESEIILPNYFEALNKDFRYQLTCIGKFSQVIVLTEIKDNKFTIKSEMPNVKVSWQVTGVRRDAWAEANPIKPEIEKSNSEKGKYLNPELFNKNKSSSIHLIKFDE